MKLDLAFHIIKIGCGCVNIFWPQGVFWFTQCAKCIVRVCVGDQVQCKNLVLISRRKHLSNACSCLCRDDTSI
jgi:hypothetical protein